MHVETLIAQPVISQLVNLGLPPSHGQAGLALGAKLLSDLRA